MMQPNEVSLLYATLVTITILGTVVGIVESAECSDSVKGRVLMTLAFAVLHLLPSQWQLSLPLS